MYNLAIFYNYKIENINPPTCQLPAGFEKSTPDKPFHYAAEDIEIDYENNLAFVSVGFRWKNFNPIYEHFGTFEPVFQGIYVYEDLDFMRDPIRIEIPSSNPHGISLYKLSEKIIRVFVASHPNPSSGNGSEETIYFDFDVNDHDRLSSSYKFNRIQSSKTWATNDVVAVGPNKFLASQWQYFPDEQFIKNNLVGLSTMELTSISYIEFDEKTNKPTLETTIAKNLALVNGIIYDFDRKLLFANTFVTSQIQIISWDFENPTKSIDKKGNVSKIHRTLFLEKGIGPDNLSINKDKTFMYVAGFNNIFESFVSKPTFDVPSAGVKINFETFEVEPIFNDEKGEYSASVIVEVDRDENKYLIGSPYKNMQVCGF